MSTLFGLVGVLALVISLVSCVAAKSAVQETGGLVLAVIGFLALGVAAILTELQQFRKAIVEQFGFLAQFLKGRQSPSVDVPTGESGGQVPRASKDYKWSATDDGPTRPNYWECKACKTVNAGGTSRCRRCGEDAPS
jgi:hypothetical protein